MGHRRTQGVYIPALDRLGDRGLRHALRSVRPDRVLSWYRSRGYPVGSPSDVTQVSPAVIEERVSRLRQRWRKRLWTEIAVATVAGPLGILITVPALTWICFAWGIEMGVAYGLNMSDPKLLGWMRTAVGRNLSRLFGGGSSAAPLNCPRRVFNLTVNGLLLGLGQDLAWADIIMADIREHWRREAFDRVHEPFGVFGCNSSGNLCVSRESKVYSPDIYKPL